jgi:hypothetical protein
LGTLEKKYSPGVLGFWGFGVLGFWGFGVLGFWGFGVLGFWGLSSIVECHFLTLKIDQIPYITIDDKPPVTF